MSPPPSTPLTTPQVAELSQTIIKNSQHKHISLFKELTVDSLQVTLVSVSPRIAKALPLPRLHQPLIVGRRRTSIR